MNKALFLLFAVVAAPLAFAQPQAARTIKVYAAAAVKTPLSAIAAEYEKATGNGVVLVFDTAGAAEQKFRADPDSALLITSATLIRNAESSGSLRDGTSSVLGSTVAGVAVPPGSPKPDISSPEKLKAALLSARRIAFSDPARGATVGNHFMRVIESLGVKDEVLRKATLARDGIETMRLVLEERVDIGITQTSEIVQASPDAVAGPFPREFELATAYWLWHRESVFPEVRDFVARLTGPAGRAKLAADGVIPPAAP
jgi:molybdate transport system substrate-binding protein